MERIAPYHVMARAVCSAKALDVHGVWGCFPDTIDVHACSTCLDITTRQQGYGSVSPRRGDMRPSIERVEAPLSPVWTSYSSVVQPRILSFASDVVVAVAVAAVVVVVIGVVVVVVVAVAAVVVTSIKQANTVPPQLCSSSPHLTTLIPRPHSKTLLLSVAQLGGSFVNLHVLHASPWPFE